MANHSIKPAISPIWADENHTLKQYQKLHDQCKHAHRHMLGSCYSVYVHLTKKQNDTAERMYNRRKAKRRNPLLIGKMLPSFYITRLTQTGKNTKSMTER